MILYVFLGDSNHPKSCYTVENLHEVSFISPQNCIIVSNRENGKLNNWASERDYKILVAKTNKEIFSGLNGVKFDYLISCGWPSKISSNILKLAEKTSVNSHSAYLPDYKGLSAYKHAWANGEDYSGNTVHIMDEQFDTGNILAQSKVKIYWWDTPRSILLRISEHTPALIILSIEKYNNGFSGIEGNSEKGRYFLKTSNIKFVLYRLYNLCAKRFGLKRVYTKYK